MASSGEVKATMALRDGPGWAGLVGKTPGFQAVTSPASLAKMKTAWAEVGLPPAFTPLMTKLPGMLANTWPVGAPFGIETNGRLGGLPSALVMPFIVTSPVYSVLR